MRAWKCTAAAALDLGDLAVRQPDRGDRPDVAAAASDDLDAGDAASAGEVCEVAFGGLLGAPPQLAGEHVPDDLAVVVVAVEAQRPARVGRALVAGPADGGRPGGSGRCGGRGRVGAAAAVLRSARCAGHDPGCTSPNDGAVKVANTSGVAGDGGGGLCRR